MSNSWDLLIGVLHNINVFDIWDRVKLIEDKDNRIYTIYSITKYKSHKSFTLWNWEDYTSVEEWQIIKYNPEPPIWFNSTVWQQSV